MGNTSIVLIAIFVVCGFVMLWAIKNGNNIKMKKKEKKKKSKAPKEDKFKDVVPKEKPPKQRKLQKISASAKAEKAGEKEIPTNKITKVTKEDFKNNDLDVPKSLAGEQEESKKTTEIKIDTDKSFNFKDDPTFKLTDDFKFNDGLPEGFFDPTGMDPLKDDDFALPSLENLPKMANPFVNNGKTDFDFPINDTFPDVNFDDLPMFDDIDSGLDVKRQEGTILNESITERFNQVFGNADLASSGAKEIIIGDVLAGNRSKANRELRNRRLKIITNNSLSPEDK